MNDIQNCILDIFKEIAKVCENNDIDYYGSSGTCLGAVRHQGFIPWDDDMDIVIPIEEFDKFIEAAKRELPPYLEIYTPFEKKHFSHLIIKVMDKRTAFIEEPFYKYPDSWSGVWVDVIPQCGVPTNKFRRKLFYKYLWWNMFLDLYKREDYMGSHFVPIQKMVKNFTLKHRDDNYYMRKQLEFVRKYPAKKYDYVLECGFFKFDNWTSERAWLKEKIKVKFEDTEIRIPKEYDKYLTKQYGDYMWIPPENQRVKHNGTVDLTRSYEEYIKHPEWLVKEDEDNGYKE